MKKETKIQFSRRLTLKLFKEDIQRIIDECPCTEYGSDNEITKDDIESVLESIRVKYINYKEIYEIEEAKEIIGVNQ